jgi:hypothetical protein
MTGSSKLGCILGSLPSQLSILVRFVLYVCSVTYLAAALCMSGAACAGCCRQWAKLWMLFCTFMLASDSRELLASKALRRELMLTVMICLMLG